MLFAYNSKGNRVHIDDTSENETYFCPFCNQKVIQKKGEIKIHHFSHEKNTFCEYAKHDNISEWHIEWQKLFGLDNCEKIIQIGQEKKIADVQLNNLVVELQHSPITRKEIIQRCKFYTLDNKTIVWIFDLTDKYALQQIYEHSTKYNNYKTYKWNNPSKNIIDVFCNHADDRTFLFFHLAESKVLEVKWFPNKGWRESAEAPSLKYFSGYLMTEIETVNKISKLVNKFWKPSPNFEKSDEFEWYLERKDLL